MALFLEQSYKTIKESIQLKRKESEASNLLFTDPLFPPDDSSLGKSHPGIVWQRPKDICSNPRLVVDGLAPSDLNQGFLGNCWFVAACSALALEESLWNNVVPDVKEQEWDPSHPEHYCGVFKFCFWRFGEWTEVVVDDWLPTKDGHLLFMKSKSVDEFWSALLEKAYAKLNGSYELLTGGRTGDALVDFTGGSSELIEMSSNIDDEDMKKLFKSIHEAHDQQSLISCSIAVIPGIPANTVLECGLVNGHAYTVTEVREVKLSLSLKSLLEGRERLMMLKMRNPWGRGEWNGPWSDTSDEWDRVKKSELTEIDLVIEDDGEFWMEFGDWCNWFSHVTICRIINNPNMNPKTYWHQYEHHAEWAGDRMGGAMGTRMMHNPQFAVSVNRPQLIMIDVTQKHSRTLPNGNENFQIGFFLLKIEENRIHRTYAKHPKVGVVKYFNIRDSHGAFHLESAGRYVIIPSTYVYGKEREFLLRVYTQYKASVFELIDAVSNECQSCGTAQPPCVGAVKIRVDVVHGLIKPDGKDETELNPFCKITCDRETAVTPPVITSTGSSSSSRGIDVVFKRDLVFYIKKIISDIHVEVYNRGRLCDDLLGEALLPVTFTKGTFQYKSKLLMHRRETNMSIGLTVTMHSTIDNV